MSYGKDDHTFAICAYGDSPFLRDCIESVKAQELDSWAVLCTATPSAAIRAYAKEFDLPLHINPEPPSISGDWNFAMDVADTPLVTLAHQDDVYAPEYSETMLASLNEAMDGGMHPLIFFSNYGELRNGAFVDDNKLLKMKRMLLRGISRSRAAASTRHKRNLIRFGNAISCPTVTYCKDSIELPLFSSGLRQALDWNAWERLSRVDGAFVYSPEVLMYHRIHEGSETSKTIADNTRSKEDLAMLEKFWPMPIAKMLFAVYSRGEKSNSV